MTESERRARRDRLRQKRSVELRRPFTVYAVADLDGDGIDEVVTEKGIGGSTKSVF